MEMAGHKPIGYVEFDKFARKSYQAMYDTKGEWTKHDITTVSNDDIRRLGNKRQIDVITGGFPCQAFSIAGQRKGFDDTRGTLFFEIARFADIIRPQYLFLENVKGLLSHDNGNTFETILRTLDELGYDAEWDLLNSKDFGVPQNRERVFIVGHLRGSSTRKVFPVRPSDEKVNELQKQSTNTLTARHEGIGNGSYIIEGEQHTQKMQIGNIDQHKRDRENPQTGRVYDPRGLSPSLTTIGGGKKPKIIVEGNISPNKHGSGKVYNPKGISPTVTTGQGGMEKLKIIETKNSLRVRKLTPKECWRLQGFPDELFERAAEVNSDSQLYKQAGNSVTVNVIYEIAKRLGGDNP